jgi:ribonuclease HI
MFPEHLVIRCPVLSSTIEKINLPSELCAFYTGRSSWGRKFVESHKTAGYCDPGWSGTVTLEISVDMPVEIHATERIGQLVFMKTNKPKIDYSRKPDAKYQNQELPTPSKTIVDDTINIIYVDGTVNKNPGKFGIAGVLYDNKYYCYTYEMKVTNNIMEALAIYHALDFIKSEKKNIIFSDSLLTVKAIRGEINVVKNPYAKIINKIKERLEDLDVDVEIRHRKGHTCHDFIGNKISSIMKQYNKTNKLISGNDTKIIRGDIKCIL